MAAKTKTRIPKIRIPKVRMAKPACRPIQLRYTDRTTGREIRISTGTTDEAAALEQKKDIEAKLQLGIEIKPRPVVRHDGPHLSWSEFREAYSRMKVPTFRSEGAMEAAEVRLDICENVAKPRTLGEIAKPAFLARLQAELLAGAGSPRKLPRSAHTVRSYIKSLVAALNWGHKMGWLPAAVEFDSLEVDEPDKGRPLCAEEFDRLLEAVPKVISDPADVESWRHLLRGIYESGLRLGEAMSLSWDDDAAIVPHKLRSGATVLHIPSKMQKNRKSQDVPTTPAFASLLTETPEAKRTGWVFNPIKRRGAGRPTEEQTGRIITAIGKASRIVVNAAGKTASAHDLRRSFGQRMADAGLPVRDLQAIMRHASITTTEAYYLRDRVQDQAARIAKYLGTSASVTGAIEVEDVAVSYDTAR